MRRSAHVFAPLLASTALALVGCHHPEPQRCVDEQNHVVDPKFCANLPPGATAAGNLSNGGGYYGNHGSGFIFIPHMYRNYYGGTGGSSLGDTLSGGSYAPIAGRSYSTSAGSAGGRSVSSSGTSRGGFGSSFSGGHGSSSGGGE